MKKAMLPITILGATVATAAALTATYAYLIAPSRNAKNHLGPLKDHNLFAHRGLFNNEDIPENSMAAYKKAIEKGYGIELDVHITLDGRLVVFHDDDFKRMCGFDGSPEKMNFDDIRKLRLLDTDEIIPEFCEFLELVDGQVPLIVEIKGTDTNTKVCEEAARYLDDYKGEYCMESFNPIYVGWFRKNRPDVTRGQLACPMEKHGSLGLRLRDFALENMLLNVISRPDFLAYDHNGVKKLSFRAAKLMGGHPVAWTIRSKESLDDMKKHYKAFIFERFEA